MGCLGCLSSTVDIAVLFWRKNGDCISFLPLQVNNKASFLNIAKAIDTFQTVNKNDIKKGISPIVAACHC